MDGWMDVEYYGIQPVGLTTNLVTSEKRTLDYQASVLFLFPVPSMDTSHFACGLEVP